MAQEAISSLKAPPEVKQRLRSLLIPCFENKINEMRVPVCSSTPFTIESLNSTTAEREAELEAAQQRLQELEEDIRTRETSIADDERWLKLFVSGVKANDRVLAAEQARHLHPLLQPSASTDLQEPPFPALPFSLQVGPTHPSTTTKSSGDKEVEDLESQLLAQLSPLVAASRSLTQLFDKLGRLHHLLTTTGLVASLQTAEAS